MNSIQTLPQDVQSIIWLHVGLEGIIHLRQTCTAFQTAISRDKQLWAHILDRDVKAKSLPLPYNLRSIEDVDVHDLESCVKHAVTLGKSYGQADKKLFTREIENRRGLAVSWLKLLRGRWCLVASSNTEESQFSVWENLSEDEVDLATRIYLEAPVIDGLVDDSEGHLRCAITVGSSTPYILVLSITRSDGKVTIRQLVEIVGASHVRFLRGDVVGFSVKDGDDTYPYIMNWRTGCSQNLFIPNGQISPPFSHLPLGSCVAMTIKDGYILTLHPTTIQVFAISDTSMDGPTALKHISSLFLSKRVYSGQFMNAASGKPGIKQCHLFMRVYLQDFDSRIRQVLVMLEEAHREPSFTVLDSSDDNIPGFNLSTDVYHYCFGPSAQRVFYTETADDYGMPPNFATAQICRELHDGVDQTYCMIDSHTYVRKDGLPLPHFFTWLDFDDGRGVLLVGTITGDVRIASFLEKEIITRRSLLDDLPEDRREDSLASLPEKIHEIAIGVDLPLYYKIRTSFSPRDTLPANILEEAIRPWQEKGNGLLPFSNWSNDWTQFSRMRDWIKPFPLWGALDLDFEENVTSAVARDRLNASGDIVPVLYDVNDHFRVIFRTGERLFHCITAKPGGDEENLYMFESDDRIILGMLPCTYGRLLSNPPSIIPLVSEPGMQWNLRAWHGAQSTFLRTGTLFNLFWIRSHEIQTAGSITDDSVIETWSKEEWNSRYKAAGEYFTELDDEGRIAFRALHAVFLRDHILPH